MATLLAAATNFIHIHRMSYTPDVDAYFARIGYTGPTAPTREVLDAIMFAHVQAIPFENLDVLLGRGIDIDPAAVERKLVHERRGGYCFEQNSLLLHVLSALGYAVTPLSARVRMQQPRDYIPVRAHLILRVDLGEQRLLADVGVGSMSLTCSLLLDSRDEQQTSHEPRRIVAEGAWSGELRAPDARLFHQARLGSDWQDVYELTLEEMPEIDRQVGNWYTSTHPQSHFRHHLMAARTTRDGRLTLRNRELTVRDHAGVCQSRVLQSQEELREALADSFGLHFAAHVRFECSGLDWSAR